MSSTAVRIPLGLAQMMTARDALETVKQINEEIKARRKPPGIDDVVQLVAKEFGVRPTMILRSRSRHEPLATARFVAIALCLEFTLVHALEVAAWFGRERSLTSYARIKVKDREETEPEFKAKLAALRAKLEVM